MNYFDVLPPTLGLLDFIDLPGLIKTFGYLGIIAVIFAESGLFFGFFLPGDSLLFTAGVVASGVLLPGAGPHHGAPRSDGSRSQQAVPLARSPQARR